MILKHIQVFSFNYSHIDSTKGGDVDSGPGFDFPIEYQ